MKNTRIVAWGLVMAIGVFGLSGCGNGDAQDTAGGEGGAAETTEPTDVPGGGRYGYGSGTGGGGDSGSGEAETDVTVEASNFRFTPSTVEVVTDDVLGLENTEASTPHTFTVDGEDIDVALDAGSSTTLTIDLAAGTYAFECRFHASQGMTGSLMVG